MLGIKQQIHQILSKDSLKKKKKSYGQLNLFLGHRDSMRTAGLNAA